MEFLKSVLGEELFKQVADKIDEHNGAEDNKDNQLKLGNLGKGEYVAKGKYDTLAEQLTSKETELKSANDLIAELKKGTSDNEKLQGTIADYEARTEELQKELAETQLKSALKIALLSEKALDIDYLSYKLNQNGEEIVLDENGKIKGWDDMITGLKTNYPSMFENADGSADGFTPVDPKGLPKGGTEDVVSKEDIMKMSYNKRAELYAKDPDAFNNAMKN